MNINSKPNLLNSFLLIYFFELEKQLNNSDNQLLEVKFQSEEANTDEFLKKYFKDFISKNNNIRNSNLKQLHVKIDEKNYFVNVQNLFSYKIINVLLPEELSEEQRQSISTAKKSVYTSPDLYLEITDGSNSYFESVELKSTKNNNISGSSVQQIAPFEWVVFVKRGENKVVVTTGYYLNSITDKLPFPDRSPRPQIGFRTLAHWNSEHRKVEKQVLIVENFSEINEGKLRLLNDWQEFLAQEWMQVIEAENIKTNEKWFNNTLRIFALKFLKYTEKLSQEEKRAFKEKLGKMIKE